MTEDRITRRTALTAAAVCAGSAALPTLAGAASAAALPAAPTRAPRWHDATAEELQSLIGQRFRFEHPQIGSLALRLTGLVPHPEDPGRPAGLPRRAGVTALFEGPDMDPLVAAFDGLYQVSHPRLGAMTLHASAHPRTQGGHFVEIVLN